MRSQWRYSRSRSEEHTSELQSPCNLVCRLLLEKKKAMAASTFGTRFRRRVGEPRTQTRARRHIPVRYFATQSLESRGKRKVNRRTGRAPAHQTALQKSTRPPDRPKRLD